MAKTESHIPKLRFSGFSDEWNVKTLSQISSRVQEKNKDNQITETFTNSAERGIINQRDFFDKDISNEANLDNYYIVQSDDFVYNPRISNFAPVGPIKRNKLGRSGVMSPLYSVFRPDSDCIDFDFLEHYFSTTNWHKFMFTHGDQGARSDRFAIGMVTFQKMPIALPELKEQTQIGTFFQKIDQVIELQQKTLATAQDYKKAMLQKMFPQQGEKIPQIRFSGFSGDWDSALLNDFVTISNGTTCDISLSKGKYRVTRIETISDGYINIKRVGYLNELPDSKYLMNIGDILYSNINSLAHIGKVAIYDINNYKLFHGINLLRLIPNLNLADPRYLYYLFNTVSQRNWAKTHANQAVSQASINQTTLGNQTLRAPKLQEQQKIGSFFQKLDTQIEQHEKKLATYQNLKKAMLQRMFV